MKTGVCIRFTRRGFVLHLPLKRGLSHFGVWHSSRKGFGCKGTCGDIIYYTLCDIEGSAASTKHPILRIQSKRISMELSTGKIFSFKCQDDLQDSVYEMVPVIKTPTFCFRLIGDRPFGISNFIVYRAVGALQRIKLYTDLQERFPQHFNKGSGDYGFKLQQCRSNKSIGDLILEKDLDGYVFLYADSMFSQDKKEGGFCLLGRHILSEIGCGIKCRIKFTKGKIVLE